MPIRVIQASLTIVLKNEQQGFYQQSMISNYFSTGKHNAEHKHDTLLNHITLLFREKTKLS
jgi:hypothetical protein